MSGHWMTAHSEAVGFKKRPGVCLNGVGGGVEGVAELSGQGGGLQQDVQGVADGRALVAADVADAGLQQRLGDRHDALAVECVPGAEPQVLDLAAKRDFHVFSLARGVPPRWPCFRPSFRFLVATETVHPVSGG